MRDTRSDVVDTSDQIIVTWKDIRVAVRATMGIVHGLVAFFAATTFGWNYADWTPDVTGALLGCVIAGIVAAVMNGRWAWRPAFLTSIGAGLVVDIGLGIAGGHIGILTVMAGFATLLAGGLVIPYERRSDTTDGCVYNLRVFSVISILGVLLYLLVTSSVPQGRTGFAIADVLICSFGTLFAQVWFTRYVQSLSTKLSGRALRYSAAGILALGAWFRTLGPLVKSLIRFLIFAAILLALMPWLLQLMQHLKRSSRHVQTQQSQPSSIIPKQWTATQHHAASHPHEWMIWAAIVIALLIIAIVWILRKKDPKAEAQGSHAAAYGPITVMRGRPVDPFRLARTNHPIRKAFQQQLTRWHRGGHTIERTETAREWAQRLPESTDRRAAEIADDPTLEAYERARYGKRDDQEP